MRRALPNREVVLLEKFYEDFMYAQYGSPTPEDDTPSEEEIIANAPWEADVIVGGQV